VVRKEIVFIVGGGTQTSNLNLVLDAIKYQFTGEDGVQGRAPEGGEGDEAYEPYWRIFQLYAGKCDVHCSTRAL
jgi:hypothetical protein